MQDRSKHAVVTGGAGFIGSHLVDALVARGWKVDIIDNLIAGNKERINSSARLHEVDIRDAEAIEPIVRGADYVFHMAALPSVEQSIREPKETHDVNCTGTLHVLEAAKAGGVKRFIYSASCAAYGDQPVSPFHEGLPAQPSSPYALQKHIGEHYARIFAELHDLETVSLRYFNVFGSGQSADGPYSSVLGRFLTQKHEGKPLTITGDGEQTRDFIHVRDIVAANILAATSDEVGDGEVINVGSGRSVSINELAKLFGGPVVYLPARAEIRHALADHSRATAVLGWEPTVRFEDGIAELLREHGF